MFLLGMAVSLPLPLGERIVVARPQPRFVVRSGSPVSGLTRQPQGTADRLEYRELMVHPQHAIPVENRELFHNCASSRETLLA